MNITFIKDKSITLVTSDFRVMTASKGGNVNWAKIEAAVKANDEKALIAAMSVKKAVENFGETGKISFDASGAVFYRGEKLYDEDVSRIFDYLTSGAPQSSMVKFLDAKFRNEVPSSVEGLYRFLANKEMPITDNGTVLGFKGIRDDFHSVMTGQEPLISGTRRADGAILNTIGETVWMERKYVLADKNQGCGPGLHVGSRNYAKGFGKRTMVVEFSPENVVSVPTSGGCEVLRVNKYRVVGELLETIFLGNTYNNDFSRPEETPEPIEDETPAPVVEVKATVPVTVPKNIYNISEWSKGQAKGFKDGKAHVKRLFYECDVNTNFKNKKYSKEFIVGYNVGYKDGRIG